MQTDIFKKTEIISSFAVRLEIKQKSWKMMLFTSGGQLIGKDPNDVKDWGHEEKGVTENVMIGWHHWLDGHEFEQTMGDSER